MLKVGLTGGVACGKSTVAAMLSEMGCEVVDADQLGHQAIAPGGPAYQAVLDAFGSILADAQGPISRPLLAERVFARPAELARLNAIVHPAIMELVERRCREFARRNPRGILVVDAALIFEARVEKRFQKVIVVDCTPEQQAARFVARGLGGEEEARSRIAAQLPRKVKLACADFVVDSSGALEETRRQVEEIYQELRKLV